MLWNMKSSIVNHKHTWTTEQSGTGNDEQDWFRSADRVFVFYPISSAYSPALPQRACAVILRSKAVVSRAVSAEPRRDPAPLPQRFSSDRNDSIRSDRSVSLSAPGILTGVSVKRSKHSRNQTETSSGSWILLFFWYLSAIRTVL